MAALPIFRLCYITGPWAYFTTQDIQDQWGDDFDDAPYEHNAGLPYQWDDYDAEKGRAPWSICKVAFEADLDTPADWAYPNSTYSVQDINSGKVPWLQSSKYTAVQGVQIYAGTTLEDFKRIIKANGGAVYMTD